MLPLRRLVVVLTVLVGIVGVVVFAGIRRNGLSADRAPSGLETAVAHRIVAFSIPAAARTAVNPHTSNDAWRSAAPHFADHCAACHGRDGRGDSELGPHMYPPVPDLASPSVQQLSDGALFWIIQHGIRWTGMPAFRDNHTEDETWRLVSFIRHVREAAANSSPAEPKTDAPVLHNTILLDGTTFTPAELEAHAGDTITWINRDPVPHDVTASDGRFHTPLQPDEQWQFRATTPERIEYVCTLHPGMKGVLVIRP